MDSQLIKNKKELDDWIKECKSWDSDAFEYGVNCPELPSLVVWCVNQANGYPYIEYSFFTSEEIDYYQKEIISCKLQEKSQ